MDFEEIRAKAKQHLHDLYPLDRKGKGIVCPLCDNGSGSDGDGVTFIKTDREGNSNSDILHCFKCGFSGDVIQLKATETHLTYVEAAKVLARELNIPLHDELYSSHSHKVFRKLPTSIPKPAQIKQDNYSDFFNATANDLEKTDYYKKRGFSLDTCRHFKLGFVFAWSHPKVNNAPKSPRLIVPTSPFSYLARDTRKNIPDYQQKYAKQKVGTLSLFNTVALDADFTFVVEGEFDAISFHEVGYNAVALGTISNLNKFINHIKSRSVKPKCLILALDNDTGGKETTLKLKHQLDNLNVPSVIATDIIYGSHKDANEALVADRNSFKQNAEKALEDAKRITADVTTSSNTETPASDASSKQTVYTTNTVHTGNSNVDDAIAKLNAVTTFDNATILKKDSLQLISLCKVYAPDFFANFRAKCKAGSVDLKVFDDQINELIKPIKRKKKREDKELEYQQNLLLAKQRRQQHEQERISDLTIIQDLYLQSPSKARNDKIISLILKNLERNRYGEIKANTANFEFILHYDPYISGCVGYDVFTYKMVVKRPLPWTNQLVNRPAWSNSDDNAIANYISRTYEGLDSFKTLLRAIDEYAFANSFHPVQDYLNSLPTWDGIKRAETFFIDTLKVTESYYARCVTLHWLIAAVARIFHPGCKWDYALILKGNQGIGKSSAFAKLGGKWFNDSIDSISGKDAVEQLLGSWIIELGEMQAAKKSTNENIKSFISRRIDKIRLPYLHRSEEYFRQAVFAGTTNNEEFLKDPTGGRRFFILVALANDSEVKERLAKIDQNYIDQLWAEVLTRYKELFKDGFDDSKLIPPQEVFTVAKQLQDDYTEGSELEGMIKAYLDILLPKNWNNNTMFERRNFVQNAIPANSEDELSNDTDDNKKPYYNDNNHSKGEIQRTVVAAVEIAYELFRVDNPSKERALLRQINEILARLDGWKRTTWKRCGVYGQQRIAFERDLTKIAA
jgi:predicted P-loop ATPase